MTRRDALKMGAAIVAAMDIASCKQTAGNDAAALQMMYWGAAELVKETGQAIGLFQQRYPHIKIAAQFTSWQAYPTVLATRMIGDDAPDLLQIDTRYLTLYTNKKLLLNLSRFIPGRLNLSDFDQTLLNSNKDNGVLYGIPQGGQFQALFYNRFFLEQAALPPPASSMTWGEFANYAQKVTKALKFQVYGSADPSSLLPIFEMFIRQKGKEMFNADGTLNVERRDMVEWWSYWNDLRAAGGCLPVAIQQSYAIANPAQTPFVDEKVALYFSSSNTSETFQRLIPHPLGLVLPPVEKRSGLYFKPSSLIGAAANTRYREEVLFFIDFFLHDREVIQLFGLHRGVPGSARAIQLLAPTLSPQQRQEVSYVHLASLPGNSTPKRMLDPPGAGAIEPVFIRLTQAVNFGQQSMASAADSFIAESVRILKEAQL
jgi:multiple sugar transport system substrate-binding protein